MAWITLLPTIMEKYLLYLHGDIEALTEQAPAVPDCGHLRGFPEDDFDTSGTKYLKLSELFDLPAEAFPPEKLLTLQQVTDLVIAIEELWSVWNLFWEIPFDLPERKHYTALVNEMNRGLIAYHHERGGEVKICDLAIGKPCPFQPDDSYCYCREIVESAEHDIALWEEYVRSQGLDPYREMTPEEEEAFDEEMRQRDLKKGFKKDWRKRNFPDWLIEFGETEEELFQEDPDTREDSLDFNIELEADEKLFLSGIDPDADWMDFFDGEEEETD